MRLSLLAGLVVALIAASGGGSAQSVPPTPPNLEVIDTTADSITVAWGPSQPGPFSATGTHREVTVTWGPSEDDRSPVSYDVTQDGTTVATGQAETSYTFTVDHQTTSFEVCVTPVNAAGQVGNVGCSTISR